MKLAEAWQKFELHLEFINSLCESQINYQPQLVLYIAINSAFCRLGSPAPRIVEKAAEARANNNKERNKMKKEIEREAKLGKSRTYQLITQQENPED